MSKHKLNADALEVETFPAEPVVEPTMIPPNNTMDAFTCWGVDCTYAGPCV